MRNRRVSPLDSISNSSVEGTEATTQIDKDDKNRSDSDGKSLLHNLARAGNVIELTEVIDRVEVDPEDPNRNTILHMLAERPTSLKSFFQCAVTEGKIDFVQKLLTQTTIGSQTFLAVAICNVSDKQMESDIIKLMDIITKTCMKESVETLFQHKDDGQDNLLHLAVDKGLKELVCYLLTTTQELSKQQNRDGFNPFHWALYKNNTEIISCFLEIVKSTMALVNDPMPNKETPLHLATKLGNTQIVKELIRHGGDLSSQDKDGQTPLHDCLQQVHFEGGSEEKAKCQKFIRVWNAIVEEAVTWWCLKHSTLKEIKGSERYYSYQRTAVYYLRSCILNKDKDSVLDYGAVMGLTPCVQEMLITKDVFVVKERMLSVDSHTKCDNLCCKFRKGKPQSEKKFSLYRCHKSQSRVLCQWSATVRRWDKFKFSRYSARILCFQALLPSLEHRKFEQGWGDSRDYSHADHRSFAMEHFAVDKDGFIYFTPGTDVSGDLQESKRNLIIWLIVHHYIRLDFSCVQFLYFSTTNHAQGVGAC